MIPPVLEASPCLAMFDYYAESDRGFVQDILLFGCTGGTVVITPEVAVIARPARHDWTTSEIVDPLRHPTAGHPATCWAIHYLAGSIDAALRAMPHPLPYVAFQRVARGDPRVRVMPIERFQRYEFRKRRTPSPDEGSCDGHESAGI